MEGTDFKDLKKQLLKDPKVAEEYGRIKMLDKIKDLEKKYGKHKFCYQCGNPDIIRFGEPYDPNYAWCPKCGSSDLDE